MKLCQIGSLVRKVSLDSREHHPAVNRRGWSLEEEERDIGICSTGVRRCPVEDVGKVLHLGEVRVPFHNVGEPGGLQRQLRLTLLDDCDAQTLFVIRVVKR